MDVSVPMLGVADKQVCAATHSWQFGSIASVNARLASQSRGRRCYDSARAVGNDPAKSRSNVRRRWRRRFHVVIRICVQLTLVSELGQQASNSGQQQENSCHEHFCRLILRRAGKRLGQVGAGGIHGHHPADGQPQTQEQQ